MNSSTAFSPPGPANFTWFEETLAFLESFPIEDLDEKVAKEAAELYTSLQKERESVPEFDVLVAATAMSSDSTLVSKDEHFDTIREHEGELKLEKY